MVLRKPRGRDAKRGGAGLLVFLHQKGRLVSPKSLQVSKSRNISLEKHGPRNRDGRRMEAIAPIGMRP